MMCGAGRAAQHAASDGSVGAGGGGGAGETWRGRRSPKCLAASERTYVRTRGPRRAFTPFFSRPGTGTGTGTGTRARGVDGTTKKAFGPIVPRWPEMTVPFVFLFPGAQSEAEAGGCVSQALRIAMMGQRTRISPCPDAWTHGPRTRRRRGGGLARALGLAPGALLLPQGFSCLALSGSVRCCMRRGHPDAQRERCRRRHRHLIILLLRSGGPARPRPAPPRGAPPRSSSIPKSKR